MTPRRIYLDNAATSWPKPPAVLEAMQRYLLENGAAAGRGVYREAVAAEQLVQTARQRIARLINAPAASRIVFTHNCTDALNLALLGLLRSGDRALTSAVEHNSVLRPLRHLERERGVQVSFAKCDEHGLLEREDFERQLPQGINAVVLNHGSNVTGAIQPLAELAPLVKTIGAKLILDAAQTAGLVALDVQQLGIDLLAASGHKGLLGPLGTGFLYIAPGLEQKITPLRFGGTGTKSDEEEQPLTMPDRYEVGNANVPGIAGLSAGVQYLLAQGIEQIAKHEGALIERLAAELATLPGVRVWGPAAGIPRTPVVSFTVAGYEAHEVAALLDATWNIQVRSGLHCAPRIHRQLGLLAAGTVRMSVGPFTTEQEIDLALQALREIISG